MWNFGNLFKNRVLSLTNLIQIHVYKFYQDAFTQYIKLLIWLSKLKNILVEVKEKAFLYNIYSAKDYMLSVIE